MEGAEEVKEPLEVLQESVTQNLEKDSNFSTFHEYVEHPNELEASRVSSLKKELLEIFEEFVRGMELTESKTKVKIPTHVTGYSPVIGRSVIRDSREVIGVILNRLIEQCKLAEHVGCGFGEHFAGSKEIREAKKELRKEIETRLVPVEEEEVEIEIIAHDSNNNREGESFAMPDGMWVPYQAVGLVYCESEDVALGFRSTMDFETEKWELNNFGSEYLVELSEKTSQFSEFYKRMTGEVFNEKEVKETDSELADLLRNSVYFQQLLDMVCDRWTR